MYRIGRINVSIAFFVAIFSLFACTACLGADITPTINPGPPDGYLMTTSVSATFVQFTEQHNQINGHMESVEETNDAPPQTKPYNYAFTGVQNGASITLTVPILWTSASLTGTLNGDTLTLDLPQSDGHIASEILKAASLQQYNQAVDALQKRVAQQDKRYYNAQATEIAIQETAKAQQDQQDAVSNANYYLGNALKALKSDEGTLSSFSASNTLSAYYRDWQAMQKDYAKEQDDAAKGCGDGNYNHGTVSYDANTVDYDYNSISYNDNSLSYDKNTYDADLSPVQTDIQAVKTDWISLQSAVKANTSGTPAPAYTESGIDTALTNAQNAKNTALSTWQSAQTSAGTYDSEAKDLQKKADAIPASMKCS